ncbi:lytic transglycosylase [Cryobacterium psychrophilum]|uniref:LysM peptidoglycan-binding domain-containing protein n=1 Tax=Cryobacterium psychrophilum TaxID=41988 RepID=A0A4Y8KNT0_9MICO|nr:LysM peptidoglycan-binding domain-containing protein [Cryobacterium psychrophilum]TDW31479.1 LysM repeat protein [Cryobacterium psychrophilum]TFD78911.1 LysM peptidoglycan-binding domain-containing protein [Cryobacterium psychrophilum]
MSSDLSTIVDAVAAGETPRDRRTKSGERRGRSPLVTVPIVIVGTLAISLNLAAPAQAAVAKKPLNPKLVESTTRTATVAKSAIEAAPAQYSVAQGDTVSGIAARFGLSTSSVLSLNGLDSAALIFPGQVLNLTAAAAPAPTAHSVSSSSYTVVSGDTIGGIAAAHGLSTDAVLSANGLKRSSIIYPGQAVALPTGAAPAAQMVQAAFITPMTPVTAPMRASNHTIQTGDTISGVAAAAGVSVQAVLDANGLGWSSMIYPGQVLAIPSQFSALPDATHVTPLTAEMRTNAATIVAVGRSIGVSDYGLVIALAAAAQESGLRNIDYGDRDSLGLFQQRPSVGWGSPEQTMNPKRATLAFFGGSTNPNSGVTRGLLEIAGWESMTVTQAAQAVQISAFPEHYGKWETSARAWLNQLG